MDLRKLENPYQEIQEYIKENKKNPRLSYAMDNYFDGCILFGSVLRIIGEEEFNSFFNSMFQYAVIEEQMNLREFLRYSNKMLRQTDCFSNVEYDITLRSMLQMEKTGNAIYFILNDLMDRELGL